MDTIDIILLALFVPALIIGLVKGLVVQVVSLVSIFVSAILAGRFAQQLADIDVLQFNGVEPRLMYVICFILIFLVSALILALLGKLVTKLIKAATLGWVNRLLGAAFALFTTAFLLGLLISVFEGLNANWGLVDPERLENLQVYPRLRDFSAGILPQLKVFIGQYITPEQCATV